MLAGVQGGVARGKPSCWWAGRQPLRPYSPSPLSLPPLRPSPGRPLESLAGSSTQISTKLAFLPVPLPFPSAHRWRW